MTTQQSTEPMDVDQPGAAASLNQSADETKEDDGGTNYNFRKLIKKNVKNWKMINLANKSKHN